MQMICTLLQTDNHSTSSLISMGRMFFLPPNRVKAPIALDAIQHAEFRCGFSENVLV